MPRLASSLLLGAGFLLAGCVSTGGSSGEATHVPATRADALIMLIEDTQSHHPERLDSADAEITALVRALSDHDAPAARGAVAPSLPEIDLSDARSVLSAVHIASYRTLTHAQTGWAALQRDHGELSGLNARISQADLGERGLFLRLKAGPFDSPDAANSVCTQLRAQGLWCATTDFTGDQL